MRSLRADFLDIRFSGNKPTQDELRECQAQHHEAAVERVAGLGRRELRGYSAHLIDVPQPVEHVERRQDHENVPQEPSFPHLHVLCLTSASSMRDPVFKTATAAVSLEAYK
jgi:hypothetical protein